MKIMLHVISTTFAWSCCSWTTYTGSPADSADFKCAWHLASGTSSRSIQGFVRLLQPPKLSLIRDVAYGLSLYPLIVKVKDLPLLTVIIHNA